MSISFGVKSTLEFARRGPPPTWDACGLFKPKGGCLGWEGRWEGEGGGCVWECLVCVYMDNREGMFFFVGGDVW